MGHHGGESAENEGAAPHEGMSTGKYLATRFSTLKPPMLPVPNPWKLVRMLDAQQWAFFALAFSAWVRAENFPCMPWAKLVLTKMDRRGMPLTSSRFP